MFIQWLALLVYTTADSKLIYKCVDYPDKATVRLHRNFFLFLQFVISKSVALHYYIIQSCFVADFYINTNFKFKIIFLS